MPIELFHVSTKKYQQGQVITVPPGKTTEYIQRLSAENNEIGEDRLEKYRPHAAQNRSTAQYAFADVNHCLVYGQSQYKKQNLIYYQVEMVDPTKVPMALVNEIKKQKATVEQLAKMVDEYWAPRNHWEVYEFLAASMTIVQEIPEPKCEMEMFAACLSYHNDVKMAEKFCATVKAEDRQ